MKNTSKIIMLVLFSSFILLNIPYTDNVKASYIEHPFGFEGVSAPGEYSDSYVTTKSRLDSTVTSSNMRTGTRAYQVGDLSGTVSASWFNISGGSFLTNFSFYYSASTPGGATYFFIAFANRTLAETNSLNWETTPSTEYQKGYIAIWAFDTTGYIKNVDESGNLDVMLTIGGWNLYHHEWIRFDNDIGDLTFGQIKSGDSLATANNVACNGTAINEGYVIDIIYFYGNVNWNQFIIDDCNFRLSSSYTEGEEAGGCISTTGYSYYSENIAEMDGYVDVNYPFIEFTSYYELTLTPYAFELWVGSAQYENDDDVSNYYLYVNGLLVGNPECIYLLSGLTYVIQWNLSSLSNLDNVEVRFEVAHTELLYGSTYWNIARRTSSLYGGEFSPTTVTYGNTASNGWIDGTLLYYGSCWKLFYSSFGGGEDIENNDLTVGINIIGANAKHPSWNIPFTYVLNTIYFEIFSNRTDNYYYVNISNEGVEVGQTQGYPSNIYSYYTIKGFTPYSEGNYTAYLCNQDDDIIDYIEFNATDIDVSYALWSFPNPSNPNGVYSIGIYAKNPTNFDSFWIGRATQSSSMTYIEDVEDLIGIANTSFDVNGFYSVQVYTLSEAGGTDYLRLWGRNGEINFPITSVYKHHIQGIIQANSLYTSLVDGDGKQGEQFTIYGTHGFMLSDVRVFLKNEYITDALSTTFSFPYAIEDRGVYQLTLRVNNGGNWEVVKTITITILGSDEGGSGSVGIVIEPPLSWIISGFIIGILTLVPSGILSDKTKIPDTALGFISFIFCMLGIIICILFGFIPSWVVAVALFSLILIIVVMWMRNKNASSSG